MSSIPNVAMEGRPAAPHQPIPGIPCEDAVFVVTIDGRPYAGFINRACAESAVGLWSGEVDGGGFPVPSHERARRGWSAARGRVLQVVERGYGHPR